MGDITTYITNASTLVGTLGSFSPQVAIRDIDFAVYPMTTANEYQIMSVPAMRVVTAVTVMLLTKDTGAGIVDIGVSSGDNTFHNDYAVGSTGTINVPTRVIAQLVGSATTYIWLGPATANLSDGKLRVIVEFIDCSLGV